MYRIATRRIPRLLMALSALLSGLAAVADPSPPPSGGTLQLAIQSPPAGCTVVAVDGQHPLPGLLDQLYGSLGYTPLWTTSARYEALIEALDGLVADGLDPARYGAVALREQRERHAEDGAWCRELLASSAYLVALHHLNHGALDRARLEPLWVEPGADVATLFPAPADALDALARDGLDDPVAAFARARPALPLYHRLREAHGAWRGLTGLATWPRVPAGPLLKPGMSDPRVALLRERLALVGLVTGTADVTDVAHYGDDLVAATRAFQRQHGIEVDGVVGNETLRELNTARTFRQDQGALHPHAAGAEGALVAGEQVLAGGVVQVHGEGIGKANRHQSQGACGPCILAQPDGPGTAPIDGAGIQLPPRRVQHPDAVPGQVAEVATNFRQLVLAVDGGWHCPGGIEGQVGNA